MSENNHSDSQASSPDTEDERRRNQSLRRSLFMVVGFLAFLGLLYTSSCIQIASRERDEANERADFTYLTEQNTEEVYELICEKISKTVSRPKTLSIGYPTIAKFGPSIPLEKPGELVQRYVAKGEFTAKNQFNMDVHNEYEVILTKDNHLNWMEWQSTSVNGQKVKSDLD